MENITVGQILGVISGITIIIGFVKLIYELLKTNNQQEKRSKKC